MTTKITVVGGDGNAVRVLLQTLNDRGDFQSETEEVVEAGESRDFYIHQALRATIIEAKPKAESAPHEVSAAAAYDPKPHVNTNFEVGEGGGGGSAAILAANPDVKVAPLPGSETPVEESPAEVEAAGTPSSGTKLDRPKRG